MCLEKKKENQEMWHPGGCEMGKLQGRVQVNNRKPTQSPKWEGGGGDRLGVLMSKY